MSNVKKRKQVKKFPKPQLLQLRWVCAICLRVIHECLKITWRWEQDRGNGKATGSWVPLAVEGPMCHGHDMLILGEPKTDVHGIRGYGLIIDPLDTMRCPRV